MKTLTLLAPFLSLPCLAVASIPLGRGEVTLSASASATYDTNVTGGQNEKDDAYGTLYPRANYERKAGQIEASAMLGVSILRYFDQTQLDSENLIASGTLTLAEDAGQKLKGSLKASYTEDANVNGDLNTRIRSKSTSFTGNGTLSTGPRTSLGFNGTYSNSTRSAGSDQEMYGAGGSFNYQGFLNDTTLGLNYNYSETHSSGENVRGVDLDQKSHQFGADLSRPLYRGVTGRIGAGYRILDRSRAETLFGDTGDSGPVYNASIDGPFLPPRLFPKVKSSFSISYQDAASPGINDPGSKSVAGSLNLSWQARANTTVSFDANRAQRLTADDFTSVSTSLSTSINQAFSQKFSGSVGGAYTWEDYKGITRNDSRISANANLFYSFARKWSSSLSYRYETIDSSNAAADFDHHVIVASVTYQF